MQIGDKYRNKSSPWIIYTITGIYNTISPAAVQSEIGCTYEDTKKNPGTQTPYGSRVSLDLFLNNTEPVLIQAQPIPNVHPMNVMGGLSKNGLNGLGGDALDALALSMGMTRRDSPPPLPKCDCGGKACGFKDYTRQHSSWCKVYKE